MAETGYADLGSARFYYEAAGQGEPLILVHAGIADRRMWDSQFEAFARHCRVIRYDRRGFGRTTAAAGPYSHHQDLQDLLEYLDIREAVLVGCSQGGRTVIDTTLQNPGTARALVLVSSALSGFAFQGEPPRQVEELERAEVAGDLELVNELELQIWVDGPRRTAEQVDAGVRELVRDMNRIALSTPELGEEQPLQPPAAGRLAEIGVPTLVIMGDEDQPRTIAAGAWLAENIPGARKLVMGGTAHLPNMERPEEFNDQVLEFLSGLPDG